MTQGVTSEYRISALGYPNDAIKVASQYPETLNIWMGKNTFQLNPSKAEWLWEF